MFYDLLVGSAGAVRDSEIVELTNGKFIVGFSGMERRNCVPKSLLR
jgi:hypothetical protein